MDNSALTSFLALLISVGYDMNFGEKIKKLREEKKISQQELVRRLGYKTNSYISDVESGHFIPSEEKLKEMAKALGVPFSRIKDLLLEAKIEELVIKEPGFISMFKDYPHLTKEDKRTILKAYLKIKEEKKNHEPHNSKGKSTFKETWPTGALSFSFQAWGFMKSLKQRGLLPRAQGNRYIPMREITSLPML